MRHEIQLVGKGGQGMRVASSILSLACGVYDGKNVAETHLYGAEARGGLSQSELVISDEEIYYVKVQFPDILLALSQYAYDTYAESVKEDGLILADEFYVEEYEENDERLRLLPLTRTALDIVEALIAVNVVSLGVMSAVDPVLNYESVKKGVKEKIKKQFLEKNLEAFEEGFEIGKELKVMHER